MDDMQKTKIEYVNYSWNPIKGLCTMNCHYCYSHRIYKRFKMNPEIRFDEKELQKPLSVKKPSRIFVCSTMEIFNDKVDDMWIAKILEVVYQCPQHTFLFLSKLPEGYSRFCGWPSNCWLGVTITGSEGIDLRKDIHLKELEINNLKYISFEPLLNFDYPIFMDIIYEIDWIIIGGLTPYPAHRREWVDKMIKFARREKIPVFLKDNLKYSEVIKEYPDGKEYVKKLRKG